MKFKNWFSKKKEKDITATPQLQEKDDTAKERDEWYDAEEEDGILQKFEKPHATTFKKKWIYGIGGLLIVIFSVSLVMGLVLGTNRKTKKVEEEVQQQNVVKGSHLQNMQKDDKKPKVQEKKAPQEIVPPPSPPPVVRSYSPVPQSRYVPQVPHQSGQASQRQLTEEEKELQKRLEAKQKANESPIKFNLELEEKP